MASDLDLLVMRPDGVSYDEPRWRNQLAGLTSDVQLWTGRRLSWLELSADELRAAVQAREPIVAEWRRDGVLITGKALAEVDRRAA